MFLIFPGNIQSSPQHGGGWKTFTDAVWSQQAVPGPGLQRKEDKCGSHHLRHDWYGELDHCESSIINALCIRIFFFFFAHLLMKENQKLHHNEIMNFIHLSWVFIFTNKLMSSSTPSFSSCQRSHSHSACKIFISQWSKTTTCVTAAVYNMGSSSKALDSLWMRLWNSSGQSSQKAWMLTQWVLRFTTKWQGCQNSGFSGFFFIFVVVVSKVFNLLSI